MGSLTITNFCQKVGQSESLPKDFDKNCQFLVETIEKLKFDVITFQKLSAEAIPHLKTLKDYAIVANSGGFNYSVILARKDRFRLEPAFQRIREIGTFSLIQYATDTHSSRQLKIINAGVADAYLSDKDLNDLLEYAIIKSKTLVIGGGIFQPSLDSPCLEVLKSKNFVVDNLPPATGVINHIFAHNALIKSAEMDQNLHNSPFLAITATIEIPPLVKSSSSFKNNQPEGSFRGLLMQELMRVFTVDTKLLTHIDTILTNLAKGAPSKGLDSLQKDSSSFYFERAKVKIKDDLAKYLNLKKKYQYQQGLAARSVQAQFALTFVEVYKEFTKDSSPIGKNPTQPVHKPQDPEPPKPSLPIPPLPIPSRLRKPAQNVPPLKKRGTFLTLLIAPYRLIKWIVLRIFAFFKN